MTATARRQELSFSWRKPVGWLRVCVVTAHAPTRDRDDLYLIDECPQAAGLRHWLVFKYTGPAHQEPYDVHRLPGGGMSCSCKAATTSFQATDCRHKQLCRDGIEQGEL